MPSFACEHAQRASQIPIARRIIMSIVVLLLSLGLFHTQLAFALIDRRRCIYGTARYRTSVARVSTRRMA